MREPRWIPDTEPDGHGPTAACEGADAHGRYAEDLDAISGIRTRLRDGTHAVDTFTADQLTERFASLRRHAVEEHDMLIAELAFSGELVFAALARHPAALDAEELAFLDHAMATLRTLGAMPAPARARVSLDPVDDAFDRLLARIEHA